jgi:hypothetical protein
MERELVPSRSLTIELSAVVDEPPRTRAIDP